MTGRDRRAVALGSTLVLAAWLMLQGVPRGLSSLRRLETATDQQLDLLSRANDRLARLPALDDSLALLAGVADSLPGMLLIGDAAEAARVDLMTRVRALAEGRPVRIHGFEPASVDDTSDQLGFAAVVVLLQTDLRGLFCFLRGVEEESPAMAVEALEVTATNPDDEAPAAEFLSAKVTVSGWFRAGVRGKAPQRTEADG